MCSELRWLGLIDKKVEETLKNAPLTKILTEIVRLGKPQCVPKETGEVISIKTKGNLFYSLGTKIKAQCNANLPLMIKHIANGNIRNEAQFNAAMEFLLTKSKTTEPINEKEFMQNCGAGVVVSPEQIEDQVKITMKKYNDDLIQMRYSFNVGKILSEVKQQLKWAEGSAIKTEVDMRILNLLGPKTHEELNPAAKKKVVVVNTPKAEAKPKKVEPNLKAADSNSVENEEAGAESIDELLKARASYFHKVGENYKSEGYVVTPKTMTLLAEHVKQVNGRVRTRFPPEPNGILHIGHAKAININFGFAKANGGDCILRFDDTNPEKEEEKFFKGIQESVRWLGYEPFKITHSSDNFQQLYEWAEKLICKGHAYVCHQKVEEMRGFDVKLSPWRERPIEESLKLFRQMKNGVFDEGKATLRLKLIMEEGKVDPVAYRIKYLPHHRTKDAWCIYPTYDYTHCLCDSIENITHSLCTKEFQTKRSSYYWLCNALDIYCPVQWEYSRLNVNYTVVSKRKIQKLTENGIVSDWDDPRLFTLTALRRRGIPAECINRFVAKLGLTVALTSIDPSMLDSVVRDYLNLNAPRTMAVLEPIRIVIENFKELNLNSTIPIPYFPADLEAKETFQISVDQQIYIERNDFREEDEKGYRRLTKKQPVGLKHIGLVLHFKSIKKNGNNEIEEIVVKGEPISSQTVKPKAFIHWVAKPVKCQVRLFEALFKHKNPEDTTVVPDGFLSDVNSDTLKILSNALIDNSIHSTAQEYNRYQFERTGYFCVDRDSTKNKLVFNRIIGLKEDVGKN